MRCPQNRLNSIADHCAPSRHARPRKEAEYLNQWLAAGYAIVASDFEGLGVDGPHPYLHCRAVANNNADAVRAAGKLGLSLSSQWLATGARGALCTGAYAEINAPELEYVGTVALGPALNFRRGFSASVADAPNPFVGAGLLVAVGLDVFEPAFDLDATLTDAARRLIPLTESDCADTLMAKGRAVQITTGETYNTLPFIRAAGVKSGLSAIEVPTTNWRQPLVIVHGTNDLMMPFAEVVDFSEKLCAQHSPVRVIPLQGKGHSAPMDGGIEIVKVAVDRLFRRDAFADGCQDLK